MKKALKYKEIVERKRKVKQTVLQDGRSLPNCKRAFQTFYLSNHCQIRKGKKKPTLDE
jgi:hypothetical protein